jgi:hypothetical protein
MDDASANRRFGQEIAGREKPRLDVGFDSFAPRAAFALADDRDDEDHDAGQGITHEREGGDAAAGASGGGCPHIDRNDARCGHRFSLGRLEQAFNVCFGAFHACPLYQRISGEVAIDDSEGVASPCAGGRQRTLVEVRVLVGHLAREPRRVVELRQTGS